jgi:hypothetical protein
MILCFTDYLQMQSPSKILANGWMMSVASVAMM